MNKLILLAGGYGLALDGLGSLLDGHWIVGIANILIGLWIAIWGVENKNLRWL